MVSGPARAARLIIAKSGLAATPFAGMTPLDQAM
jgi:hypothetical protein